jgi:hypothetical protein
MDITGCYLDELLPADGTEPWMEYYQQAYRTRSPVFGASDAPTTSGGRFTYEFGLFPLRKGGLAVAQFVAIEDYFDLTSTLFELVEWRERPPAISLIPPDCWKNAMNLTLSVHDILKGPYLGLSHAPSVKCFVNSSQWAEKDI